MNCQKLGRSFVGMLALVLLAVTLAGCIVPYTESVPRPPRPAPPPLPPAPPLPPVSVDIGYFYDALDPYGDWLRIEPFGWVWAPNRVDPFWRPYTVGRWVWTDWGWTWASRERWGWATYHYGRWTRLPRYGWVWVPDTVWGPAWVAWRHGGSAYGWAPLPPQARFRAGVGLDWGGVDIDVVIQLDWWCFVDPMRFDDPDIVRWAHPVGRNATMIRATRDVTRLRPVDDRRFVNEGFGRDEVERATRRAIPVRRLVDTPSAGERGSEVTGNDVRIYRPQVREGRPGLEPKRGRRPAPEETPAPVTRPSAGTRPEPDVRPGSRPAPTTRPTPRAKDPDAAADREWDRRWTEDWRKMERSRQEEERKAASPAAPRAKPPTTPVERPDPRARLEQIRSENRDAAENARREQLAARERAKRRAERAAPPKGQAKDDREGKKDEKKDEKK